MTIQTITIDLIDSHMTIVIPRARLLPGPLQIKSLHERLGAALVAYPGHDDAGAWIDATAAITVGDYEGAAEALSGLGPTDDFGVALYREGSAPGEWLADAAGILSSLSDDAIGAQARDLARRSTGACSLCRDLQRDEVEDRESVDVSNHFACGPCDPILLEAESLGLAHCHLDGGEWRWDAA